MLRRTSSFLSFQPSLKYLQGNRSLAKKSMGLPRTATARQPPQQASEAEELEAYVEVASELGYPLTAQQIADAAKAMAEEQLAQTSQAEQLAAEDLDLEELDKAAGGYTITYGDYTVEVKAPEGYPCGQTNFDLEMIYRHQRGCKNVHHYYRASTFEGDEWCWASDSCDKLISVYNRKDY